MIEIPIIGDEICDNTPSIQLEHILHRLSDDNEVQAMKQLSELVDTKVVDPSGETVGSVDELVVNCKTGRIERVIVKTPDRMRFSLNWADVVVRGQQFTMKKEVRS